MQTHNLKRNTQNRKGRKVGRGGKRGKTSGRGTKGQKARAGRKLRPEERDIIKKLPKLRGYKFKSISPKSFAVNLSKIDKVFKDGDVVSAQTLTEKKIVRVGSPIKILSTGEITKKITVEGLNLSKSAREKIEKAGGKIA